MSFKIKSSKHGFTLVEIIVGLAIFVSLVASVYGSVLLSNKAVAKASAKIQAAFLLEEGVEAVRYLRNQSWSTKIPAAGDPQCLNFDGINKFVFSSDITSCDLYDGKFRRTVQFTDVCRATKATGSDIDLTITPPSCTGGDLDQKTKKVTVTVSWGQAPEAYSESINFYITNLYGN